MDNPHSETLKLTFRLKAWLIEQGVNDVDAMVATTSLAISIGVTNGLDRAQFIKSMGMLYDQFMKIYGDYDFSWRTQIHEEGL